MTVLDSKAEIRADARSAAVTGVVTCEEIELSRHHFTSRRRVWSVFWGTTNTMTHGQEGGKRIRTVQSRHVLLEGREKVSNGLAGSSA